MTKKQQPITNNPALSEADEKTFNSRLQECPIAIVGMASIFADAKNLEDYWDNIFESVNGITDVPKSQWDTDEYYDSDPRATDKTYCKRGGFLPEIDFDPMEFGLPPNILELTDISQLLSLVVAREVLNDAGIGDGSGYDRDKVGITLGVGGGQKQIAPLTSRLQGPVLEKVLKASGVDSDDRAMIIEKFKKAYIGWEENSFPGMLGNVIAGRIANRFDFGGTNCVVDAACASSLSAIKLAVSDLLEYRSEVMISGGVCCDNSPFMYMSFAKTPAFTTNDDIRPFDVDSKGMMIGEGIGMMAFKRLEDAERDGDKIYAVLKGIGTSSDGRFKSIYAPRPDGQAKALKRAYEDAGFEPKSCGLIEAHGTGTKAGDAAEFSGLMKHFSHNNDDTQHIALGSVKSQIGHTKAAAGAAGMIKAVLALHHKVLPATINIDTPNPALDIENSPLYLNNETRPWMPREDGLPRRAGISSFGFGGTNFHMVLEEYQAKATGKYRLNAVPQTLLFNTKDESTLITLLNDWQSKLNVGSEEQVFVFNALVTKHQLKTPEAHEARCGFVAKNALEASDMITMALKQFSANANSEQWTTPTGLYYRKSALATAGKVVALFSGQGSQYVNMGRQLACNFPTVMQAASDMDSQFSAAGLPQLSSTSYPIPVFNADARKVQDEALRLTQHAQPAIGTFSVGLYKTFTQAGFKADFTAGHSFGELTALWAAGVLSEQDYMMLARSRGQAMAKPSSDDNGNDSADFDAGTMVAVVGEPEKVAAVIKDISDISIANYNSNNQVVVAGVTSQIAIATQALTAEGFKVVPLPVSAAFHTPLVAHAQKPFAQAIDQAKFTKPSIPVFANGTGKAHSNKAAEIKKALKNHILESVHFNKEIENIYADGGRVFVEFGPKNVLTRLVDNILQDKNDVVTIAVNGNAKKSSDKQLRQAAVQLAVLGVSLDDIDPHNAVKRPVEAVKMSALAMKLTGKSYVSAKTEKAFADALTDGRVIKQAKAEAKETERVVEKIVEKIIEVERIVEVEKMVYLNADGTVADGSLVNKQVTHVAEQTSNQSTSESSTQTINVNNNLAADIESSVSQFVKHQQQVLNVHEQYMQGPQAYAKTVDKVLSSVSDKLINGEVPESVERTLNMYHDFQSQTLRVHEQYLNNQSDNMSLMLSESALPETTSLSHSNTYTQPVSRASQQAPAVIAQPVTSQATLVSQPAVKSITQQAPISKAVAVETVAVVTTPVKPVFDVALIQTVMMEVVADKTGYPTEMLELGMDMEADLGIDSIKRVEILGAVQEIIEDLPELNPEDLAELRTLGEIVRYMQDKVQGTVPPLPPTTTPPTSPSSKITAATDKLSSSISNAIADPAPSAVVALQALSSVTKIVQDFSSLSKDQVSPNVLIVDDGSGAGVTVSSQLLKAGWQVTVLKPNWLVENSKKTFNKAVNLVEIGSNDKTVDEEQVKQLLEEHTQLDAVIYLQAKNVVNSVDGIKFPQAAKQGLMLAFVLAKLCQVKLAKVARASFVVVTRQGGTLGFTNAKSNVEQNVKADLHADLVQGGLGGLVKTLSHEWCGASDNVSGSNSDLGVFCRVVDLSAKLAADKAAKIICDELLDVNTSLIEVAHDTDNLSHNLGKRLTLVGVKTDSYALEQMSSVDADNIDSNSVFLVSGGAKGVTAHCVIEIAKQHQANFILLGRSPLLESEAENEEDRGAEPSWANGHHDEVALKKAAMQVLIASGEKPTPVKVTQFVRPILANREIIQTLTAIKAAGGHAQYVAADVTNSQSVSDAVAPALTALAEITQAKAPLVITGIIHGAGVLADKFIEQKTLAEFDAVYRTKIDGLLSLLSVCQPENIKHLVLFSSAAGFYGNPGQSDYSIANDILNKTAYRFKAQHPNAKVLSFNWGPWDGGMVTPELKRMFNARGVYIIPLDAGAKLLASELNANTNRCAQILVGNDLSKSTSTAADSGQDKSAKESSLKKPQVSRLSISSNRAACVIKTLQTTNNTFLADHVIGDDQVFPTVCAIAWMSDAVQSVYPEYVYQGINDYKLFKGLTFDQASLVKKESKDYFVEMSVNNDSQVIDDGNTLLVDSKISSVNDEGKTVFHYSGQVVLVLKSKKPIEAKGFVASDFSGKLPKKLTTQTASEAKALYQNGTLFHGESLQGISHVIECDEQGLLLACKVPEIAHHKQGDFVIPENSLSSIHNIFANDLAYQAMLVWVKRELGLGSLPSSTQAWNIYGQVALGQTFYLQLKVVKSSGKGGKRGKLVADVNFISEEGLLLAEMKSAKVTASESLNDMFLPADKKTVGSVN
jgi:acyl transferase domain-containing protein